MYGHITTRHKGGGHKQQIPRRRFQAATRTASRPRSSGSSTTRTAARTWRCCCIADGERRYIIAPQGRRDGYAAVMNGAEAPIKPGNCTCRCATCRSARRSTASRCCPAKARRWPAPPAPRRPAAGARRFVRATCACAPARSARCTSIAARPSARWAIRRTQSASHRQGRPRCAGAASVRRSAAWRHEPGRSPARRRRRQDCRTAVGGSHPVSPWGTSRPRATRRGTSNKRTEGHDRAPPAREKRKD